MTLVRVSGFTVSIEGFGAGSDQSMETPLGVGGEDLHGWMVGTRTFHRMTRKDGGRTGVDDELVAAAMGGIGAWIMGRNMFAPSRGPWPDDGWQGWWGRNPPYHSPVFVLTHHERNPLYMDGGTEFHFEAGGIHRALERAREADQGLVVSAIDASPKMVAAFRRRFPGVEVACEAAERSRFFDRTFDAALMVGLIFLMPESRQRELIRRVSGALEPGGRLLLPTNPH